MTLCYFSPLHKEEFFYTRESERHSGIVHFATAHLSNGRLIKSSIRFLRLFLSLFAIPYLSLLENRRETSPPRLL